MPPYSTNAGAALALFLSLISCSQHGGDFALLASRRVDFDALDRSYEMSRERTSGRACFSLFKFLLGLSDDAVVYLRVEGDLAPGAGEVIRAARLRRMHPPTMTVELRFRTQRR